MEDTPLVSVLMCVHNTPLPWLEEAASSILDQEYTVRGLARGGWVRECVRLSVVCASVW